MAKEKKKKVMKLEGLRTPKTPIARLPKKRRDALRVAMLEFIKDTHGGLCSINPDVGKMGLEASLEVIEELHEHGYMIFERDEKSVKYNGFRIWLFDDDKCIYEDMTLMGEQLKKQEEDDWEGDFDEDTSY